jgi:hypothetical protein
VLSSKEINLFVIIQLLKSSFFEHKAKKIGLTKLALLSKRLDNLSKAFLIFKIISGYSAIISKASVNSPEKNLDNTSKEFSFCKSKIKGYICLF